MTGAAWAAPVVLIRAPAPALAASPTTSTKLLDWDAYASGTVPPSSVTLSGTTNPTNPTTVTRSISYSADTPAGANSNRATASNEGGNVGNFLRLGIGNQSDPVLEGDRLTLTFTFSRPVYDLTFWIYDIDWVNSGTVGHDDTVYLTSGFTTVSQGSDLGGSGTSTSPWYATAPGNATTARTHSVQVRYPGPITTFSLTYFNGSDAEGEINSHIGLGDLSFRS